MRAEKRLPLALFLAAALVFCAACSPAPAAVQSNQAAAGEYVGLMTATAMETDTSRTITSHRAVAENAAFRLYADPKTLSIVLEDKKTGKCLYGTQADEETKVNDSWKGLMRSGFALEYFDDRSPTPLRVDALNGSPEIAFTAKDAGFDAKVQYREQGISLLIQVRLTDDGVAVHVPARDIAEGGTVRICGLYLYPFFGSTKLGQTAGYMLVPEGSGAIINLNNNGGKYKTPYQKRIYGDNLGTRKESILLAGKWAPREPEKIIAPYFGMAHTEEQTAFLATVEKGQYNAEILAYPNGAITDFNWIAARFIYREQYNMPTTRTKGILTSEKTPYFRDIQLRLHMLAGGDAGYTGMAKKYRQVLLEGGIITRKDAAYKTRIDFLGGDTEKTLIGDTVTPVTTVRQAKQIVSELQEQGLDDLLVVYMGWQAGGLSKNLGSGDFSTERKIGTLEEMKSLASAIAQKGGAFFLEQDFLHANPNRLYNTNTDIAKSVSQSIMYTMTATPPYDTLYFLTPGRVLEMADRYQRLYAGEKDMGVGISALSSTLFSYYSGGGVHSRGEAAEGFAAAVQKLSYADVALKQPFDYLWPQMDYLLDLKLYTSNYNFIAAEIPFLPMALHGIVPYFADYVNFEPNNREFFLKMIEYGAYPSFLITLNSPALLKNTNSADIYSCEYAVYKQQVLDYTKELRAFFSKVEGAAIASHTILSPDAVKVTYDNNVSVIINYGDTAFTAEGVSIPAAGYLVTAQ